MVIMLDNNKTYGVRLATGCLRINVAPDPDYPGLDIEFIPDDDKLTGTQTHARVLIEQPINSNTQTHDPVRALLWNDADNEDYTKEIEFTNAQSGV